MVIQLGVDDFHRVLVRTLSCEIEIFGRILRVVDRSGWICFYGVMEYVPISRLALDKPWCHIEHKGEQPVFRIVVETCTGAIFFPFRPLVNSGGFSVIGAHTEVVVHISTGKGDGVLVRKTYPANCLEPIVVAAQILCHACSNFFLTEFIS